MLKVMTLILIFSTDAVADTFDEQARTLFSHINGVPASEAQAGPIAALLREGQLKNAALLAIEDEHGHFYNTKIPNLVKPWTNEARNARADLNDFVTTVVGMVRDEVPFNQVLSGNFVWIAMDPSGEPLPQYSLIDNEHYLAIQGRGLDLRRSLFRMKQSELTKLPVDATAGVLSSRAFGSAFFNAGTNRAATRFALLNFLCSDMEDLADNTRPDFRIRRDVSRVPGGEPVTFRTKCAGCHAGMDALTGASAYYDFTDEGGLIYNPTAISPKINRGETTFPEGYVTTNDGWLNFWVEGPNASIGWRGADQGRGLKSWGHMLTQTQAFSTCMAEQALQSMCSTAPQTLINKLSHSFENDHFNLKHLFAQAALSCRFSKTK